LHERLNDGELVEIACSYHPRVSIFGQDFLYLGQPCFEIATIY
jgi:hypothetical protein